MRTLNTTSKRQSTPGQIKPAIHLEFDVGKFVVKTATTVQEIWSALKLRSDVFREEYGVEARGAVWDIDGFDSRCDHLIILLKETQEVIGTSRLICSAHHNSFYSQTEFVIDALLERPGVKLEIGRTCIHPEYRNGITLTILWRALSHYAQTVNATALFGCCCFRTEDVAEVAACMRYFKEMNFWNENLHLLPHADYAMEGLEDALARPNHNATPHKIPPLAHMYFKAGAKICSPPAHDKVFHCVDFLTVLPMHMLTASFSRKFNR